MHTEEGEGQRGRSINWSTTQIHETAGSGQDVSQEVVTTSVAPMWMTRMYILESSSSGAFLGTMAKSAMK